MYNHCVAKQSGHKAFKTPKWQALGGSLHDPSPLFLLVYPDIAKTLVHVISAFSCPFFYFLFFFSQVTRTRNKKKKIKKKISTYEKFLAGHILQSAPSTLLEASVCLGEFAEQGIRSGQPQVQVSCKRWGVHLAVERKSALYLSNLLQHVTSYVDIINRNNAYSWADKVQEESQLLAHSQVLAGLGCCILYLGL